MSRNLSTAEVARILRVKESRVREMVRSGLCSPERRGRGYTFSFQDLVVLRAAQGLVNEKIPPARVRRSLAALVQQLPQGRPLSGLRIYADGRQVVVRDENAAWHPETGQTVLNFDVDELARQVEHMRSGSESRRASRGPDARQEFERALALEDEDVQAACKAYRRALELDPALVDAYVNLGRLVHEGGDAGEAARLYHLALERSPEDPVIHFNLALALEDGQGTAAAISHYERAIELDPHFADAHFNVAGLYEQIGHGSDALRHYHAYKKLTEA
jgi:tetratricopeptide (TPR) repeat protein